ncbi:MAG: hypothetical protein HOI95_06875 [Chromatiales bacterium]|jgi:hypothetical protein|nr:hypothetical protein [Chromatiales bacterium]
MTLLQYLEGDSVTQRFGRLCHRFILAIGMLVFAPTLAAFDGPPGTQLVEQCRQNTPYCDAFIEGSLGAHVILNEYVLAVASHRLFCLPRDITTEHVRALVLEYATSHPDRLRYSSSSFFMDALENAYGCVE